MFLAYNSSQVFGMGFCRQRDNVTEDDVFNNILNRGDYPSAFNLPVTGLYADYVFGRMMKTRFETKHDKIVVLNEKLHPDFQSWCRAYRSYNELFNKAAKELNIEITIAND